MFVREVKTARHCYLRLVESFRQGDQVKQRVVAHLGRKDLLAPHLDSLVRLLQAEQASPRWVSAAELSTPQAWTWGPVLAARHLFDELGLGPILDGLRRPLRHGQPLSERVFPLVTNRLTRPGSEHALAQWLEDFYVCTAEGCRWVPQWKPWRRVKVSFEQLGLWYHTLDDLLAEKARVEKEIYLQLRNLFSLRADLVFYDVTSTYFEGRGPGLAQFGYSRDGKPRNRQILMGVVMVDGWPLAHHVFAGNRLDQTTVQEVLDDLRKRFELGRVVFVGDRGMVNVENLEKLRKGDWGYVVGLQRRRRQHIYEYIQEAERRGQWEDCPVGITASEKATPPKTRVQEVAGKEPGVRILVVHSEEREQYERSLRQQSMERARKELEALQRRVEKGELQEPEKIGAAAARCLHRHHGHRYFDWKLQKGKFCFFEHPVYLEHEKAYEGKYVLQTEERGLSAVEVVSAYKDLNEVERGFAHLKQVLDVRPVHHRWDDRVRAHVFVAALAFLLDRATEKKLSQAGSALSSPFAWRALESVRCVQVELTSGHHKLCVTRGSRHAAEVLKALGITQLDPPPPPQGQETIM